jgi:ATP-binding cassette subfamily F protein 3
VILVSHDRYLLEACVDRLWLVENGSVAPFDGDLDEYRRLVLSGGKARAANGGTKAERRISKSEARRAAADARAGLAPLRTKIAAAEKAIAANKSEIARLDAALAASGLFARDPKKAVALAKARSDAVAALAQAEEDWLEANAAYEAAMA